MNPRANWCIAVASVALLVFGIVLSQKIESDIVVTKVTVAGNTPALRFVSIAPGPHPTALLAHGVFCSKEVLFCYGEALAHAGFECLSVDLPGHGQSPQSFGLANLGKSVAEDARAFGTTDVFIGHSMGGYAGGQAVRDEGFRPRLFIAIGALPSPFADGPPLLLLSGNLDEFVRPEWVRERGDAHSELVPWCDHVLELYDPRVANSAVKAACAAVGKPVPPATTCWRWRLAGVILGWLGTIGLAKTILRSSRFSGRLTLLRVILFSLVLIFGNAAVTQTWIGSMPHWHRSPGFIAAGIVFWFAAIGLRRLKLPRWSLLGFVGAVMVIALLLLPAVILLFCLVFMALLVGTVCGAIVARRLSPRDGDITLAILAGYVVGQWMIKLI